MKLSHCFWSQVEESLHLIFDHNIDPSFDVLTVHTKDKELLQKLKPQHFTNFKKIFHLLQQDVDETYLIQNMYPDEKQDGWSGVGIQKFKQKYVSSMRKITLDELRKNKVSIKPKVEDELIARIILPKITRKWSHPKSLLNCFEKLILKNRGILVIDFAFKEYFNDSPIFTELNLSQNEITILQHIPSHVKYLQLFCNRITNVKDVSNLKFIQHLALGYNLLREKELEPISQLVSLISLDVSYNHLEDLPLFTKLISSLSHLKLLNTKGNPFCLQRKYREYLIFKLSQLKYLDETLISEEEKKKTNRKVESDFLFEKKMKCILKIPYLKQITVTSKELPTDSTDPSKPKYELVTNYLIEFAFPVFDNVELKTQLFQTNSLEDKEQIDFAFEMAISNLPLNNCMRDFLMRPFGCTVIQQQVEKLIKVTVPTKVDPKAKKNASVVAPVEEVNYPEEQNRKEMEVGKAYFDLRKLVEGEKSLEMESVVSAPNLDQFSVANALSTENTAPFIKLDIFIALEE